MIVFIVYRLAIKQVQLISYNIQGTKATGMNLNTTITVETPGNGVPTSNVMTEFLRNTGKLPPKFGDAALPLN